MRLHWDMLHEYEPDTQLTGPDIETMWSRIQVRLREETVAQTLPETATVAPFIHKKKRLFYWAAAAAVLLIIVSAGYFLNKNYTVNSRREMAGLKPDYKADVAPPADVKAVLVLANGQKIYLDSAGNGILAQDGSVQVVKNDRGELVYSGGGAAETATNTLMLPKGSKPLRLKLADGSLVWLNAASSITYPMAFAGKERKVSLQGEAYFEVAKNPAQPFIVLSGEKQVRVLGTSFNVNAYRDEKDTRVTLLEGLVEVHEGGQTGVLKPGQQARMTGEKIAVVNEVDTDEVMAWKNGEFYFNGADIKTIMRQIEKYYNVEVVYNDPIQYQFVAKISREVNVSEFLKILELTNLVHFKIEKDKITVMK